MKRLLAILFLTIYTSTAFGTVINFHYCGKRLAKVSLLNFGASGGCACNPSNKPMNCCKNDLIYQKADNHKTIHPVSITKIITFAIESPRFIIDNFLLRKIEDPEIVFDFDQRCCPQSIFLLNRVFRI